jgi:hypothetical protein
MQRVEASESKKQLIEKINRQLKGLLFTPHHKERAEEKTLPEEVWNSDSEEIEEDVEPADAMDGMDVGEENPQIPEDEDIVDDTRFERLLDALKKHCTEGVEILKIFTDDCHALEIVTVKLLCSGLDIPESYETPRLQGFICVPSLDWILWKFYSWLQAPEQDCSFTSARTLQVPQDRRIKRATSARQCNKGTYQFADFLWLFFT